MLLDDAYNRLLEDRLRELLPQIVKTAVTEALSSARCCQGVTAGVFLTLQQAADESGFAVTTLRERIKSGNLIAVRPKGTREYRIRRSDLVSWLTGSAEDAEPVAVLTLESEVKKIVASLR